MSQKALNVIFGVIIVILAATVVYLLVDRKSDKSNAQQSNNSQVQSPTPTPVPTPEPTPTPIPTPTSVAKKTGSETTSINSTWNQYTNYDLGVSFRVPKFLTPKVSSTSSGSIICLNENNTCAWSVTVKKNVASDSQLVSFFNQAISHADYKSQCTAIAEKEEGDQKGVEDIRIVDDRSDDSKCFLNFGYRLLYHPQKDIAAYWGFGQAVNIFRNDVAYDSDIADSFRFLE